ncbi:MAG: hypothetical protein IPM29_01220 [Planctomycetes bacterium]|nr:hypothetical protein [Planctomycetota bacterium]
MHTRCARALPAAAALALLAALAPAPHAQVPGRPSSWACLQTTAASTVFQRGKMAAIVDPSGWHVFSSATRRWSSFPLPTQPLTSIWITNDIVLFDAAPLYVAHASHAATAAGFAPLLLGAGAAMVNPASNRNDSVLVLRDGATLHTFSGFDGLWRSRAFPPTARVVVQRDVVLVADGNQLWAMSESDPQWIPHTAQGPVSAIYADGTIGIAEDATHVHGFSAVLGTWTSAPRLPNSANPTVSRNAAVWTNPSEALAYGATSGAFARVTTGGGVLVTPSDQFVVLEGVANQWWLFSGVTGRWTTITLSGLPTLVTDTTVAALVVGSTIHAWSATRDSFATLTGVTANVALAAATGYAQDARGGPFWLYSGLTGTWQRAPANTGAALPGLTRNGALLIDPTAGLAWAFDARTARFVSEPLGTNGRALYSDPNTSTIAAEDDGKVTFFDARRGVWVRVPKNGTFQQTALWRTTFVGALGAHVVAHGVLQGEPERLTMPSGAPTGLIAASETLLAQTGAEICAFSGTPELLSPAQFPEFRRMAAAAGATLDLRFFGSLPAAGRPASGALVLGRPLAQGVPTPFGELLIDTAGAIPLGPLSLGAAGRADLRIPIPNLPGLGGAELGAQGIVLEASGATWLTRLASFRVP